ncbi:hypothetical protein GM418_10505 [Maribellus comscasis]|uniref:Uncharacterized protein n=1 Tax=Maribellus comscasis TaxID=2681766 RepID=A0A6I6JNP4_9BACT|nr:hypothetical protein [Maribellus comscasis]QGY44071.1 hypothetical protein GM418_10505 [Maribellus comscasis]
MGRNSIQKFIDGFDVDSKAYFVIALVATLVVAGMLMINSKLEQRNNIVCLQTESSEIKVQQ